MPPHLLLLCRALARAGGVAVAPVVLLYLGSALAELAPKPGRMAALWQAMPEMGVSVVPLADLLAAALLVGAPVVLGVTVLAHGVAARTTPRVQRLLIRDRRVAGMLGRVLSVIFGSALGLLFVTSALRAGVFEPVGAIFVLGAVLGPALTSMVALAQWAAALRVLCRADLALALAEMQARASLAAHIDAPLFGGVPLSAVAHVPGGALAVPAPCSGVVQRLDVAALEACAAKAGIEVWIEHRPGETVLAGWPMARVSGAPEAAILAQLAQAFTLGPERIPDQDPRYGLSVLAETASRALSPMVQDGGTAVDVIQSLQRLLWDHTRQPRARQVRFARVHVPPPSDAALIEAAFGPLTRDGAGHIEVALPLFAALDSLTRCGREEMARAAQTLCDRLLESSETALAIRAQREELFAIVGAARR